jgi:capsule polysaccharide export protein KpsE/RkpR
MRHVALVMLLGILAGMLAHVLWFSARRPADVDSVGSALAWLQEDLQLTQEQFARVRAIHEQSSPQLQQLAHEAARMRREFDAFERRRQTVGEIDFLAFADFVASQRHFDRLCAESTRRLIAAAAEEMNPGQRSRYLDRLDPALRARSDRYN